MLSQMTNRVDIRKTLGYKSLKSTLKSFTEIGRVIDLGWLWVPILIGRHPHFTHPPPVLSTDPFLCFLWKSLVSVGCPFYIRYFKSDLSGFQMWLVVTYKRERNKTA